MNSDKIGSLIVGFICMIICVGFNAIVMEGDSFSYFEVMTLFILFQLLARK